MNPNLLVRQRGLTLVEACVALALASIAAGAVAPSFHGSMERRHIEGTAAQLRTDIQLARTLAVANNRNVRMSFESNGSASCYVVHTGASGDCGCGVERPEACVAGTQSLRVARITASARTLLRSNVHSMLFEPTRGTVTPTATVSIEGQHGTALHAIVNIMGRTRTCSPGGSLPGYRPC